jgi:hypothetical protein
MISRLSVRYGCGRSKMRIRCFNRLRMVVGIVAMLGAIVELPTAATAALANVRSRFGAYARGGWQYREHRNHSGLGYSSQGYSTHIAPQTDNSPLREGRLLIQSRS